MADDIIRAKETEAILAFVSETVAARRLRGRNPARHRKLVIVDAGCGNGYTLTRLAELFPEHQYIGIEQNDRLRALAKKQLEDSRVQVIPGDIRDPNSVCVDPGSADVLICQRVLINILDLADQKRALKTLAELVRPGGALMFIETFRCGFDNLNDARAELSLEPLPPPAHNLPLPEDFFEQAGLISIDPGRFGFSENALSSHYFVSRVLFPAALKVLNKDLKRNAHFIRFLSAALPDGIGNYAPLKLKTLTKRTRRR